MVSYFARHEVDKKGEGWGVDSAGYIAWLLWGGDAGRGWANRISREFDKKEKATMTDFATSYARIIKAEKQADGTLKVYGKATDDSIDIDKQICDPAWLKRAMPDWFTSGGNIREQHSNIAAGVATDYEEKEDGHYITALVVDPTSVKKVETGVLKGFSIGIRGPRVIRDTKAAGGRIVDGQIVEVSIVDRPANPNAKLTIAKAVDGGDLVAVKQIDIPSPADLFKKDPTRGSNKSAESEENPMADETPEVTEEVTEVTETHPDPEETFHEEVPADQPALDDADALIETAKSFLAEIKKFDQTAYDEARTSLGRLIQIEADEMVEMGHDELNSLTHLVESLRHLAYWFEGEEAEGEVAEETGEMEVDSIELAAEADEDGEMCEKCSESMKMCKCNKSADADSDEDDADAPVEKAVNITFNDSEISALVEKAVSSAKETIEAEITILKSSLAEAEQKAVALELELETVKKSAVVGGPKRAVLTSPDKAIDELLQKAASYRAFAKSTDDPLLKKGYKELAEDLEAKAAIRKENR
jgi:hypothetical protein